MKTVDLRDLPNLESLDTEIAQVLDAGGLVCLPCRGTYRITADLTNTDAVLKLVQSKRRARQGPSLVFIASHNHITSVTNNAEPLALKLAEALWPGPLTILVHAHDDLPREVRKQLTGKKKKIGVRVPRDPLVRSAVANLGRPLFVSSANLEHKHGENSPAQIRKNFSRVVDLFLDQGDLSLIAPSTVVDIVDGKVEIARAGEIPDSVIRDAVR